MDSNINNILALLENFTLDKICLELPNSIPWKNLTLSVGKVMIKEPMANQEKIKRTEKITSFHCHSLIMHDK